MRDVTLEVKLNRIGRQLISSSLNLDIEIGDQIIDKCRFLLLKRKPLVKEHLTLTKVQEDATAMEPVDLQANKM